MPDKVSAAASPSITTQPHSQSVLADSNAVFTVVASGQGTLDYQWTFYGTDLTNAAHISGATNMTLTISNVVAGDAGDYQVVVSNSHGSVTSLVATLKVLVPATITGQPTNQVVLVGSTPVLSVTAIGTEPLVYQWQKDGTNVANSGRVSGAKNFALTIASAQTNDSGFYQVIITNDYGSVTSEVASLTVLPTIAITDQPTNQSVLVGSDATFSVKAVGFATPSFLWYSNGVVLADGGRISGATSATLTLSNVLTNDSAAYQAIVTNSYGSVTSSVATLTVLVPVKIFKQPISKAVLFGSNASFTATASGTGLFGYQWYFNGSPLSDNGRISGSASPTLNISDVQSSDAGGYIIIVTNFFSSAVSQMASLTPQASLAPSMRYVALNNSNPMPPYLDWNSAATNIQDAIDAAVAGDTVLVTNGVYQTGGRPVNGFLVTNRVAITKRVTVQSVNGPSATIIQGCQVPGGFYATGDTAIRCVYMTNGAVLSGFTLTNGATRFYTSTNYQESVGAGAFCDGTNAYLYNCLIVSNSTLAAGGVYSGTLSNCVLSNNTGNSGGGGAYASVLSNCMLSGNQIGNHGIGGGAAYSTLNFCTVNNNTTTSEGQGGGIANCDAHNCLIFGNYALDGGGGAYDSVLVNCSIVSNYSSSFGSGGGVAGGAAINCVIFNNGGNSSTFSPIASLTNCCTTPLPSSGIGNITNAPLFVDLAGGNFHLQSNSPCINAGNNAYVTVTNDLDGNPRIQGGTVDIGAYEYQAPTSILSYAWAQQYGLPTDGSADYANPDGDGLNNYQEWIAGTDPTNALSTLLMLNPMNGSQGINVSWESVSGKTYFLERSTNLAAPLPFSALQSNLVGQANTTTYLDATATNSGPYFYRVGVQQ